MNTSTPRQSLINLTTARLYSLGGNVDRNRINIIADEIASELGAGTRVHDWWSSTYMTARSWKLFCSAVVKQLNHRRRYQSDAQPIKLD